MYNGVDKKLYTALQWYLKKQVEIRKHRRICGWELFSFQFGGSFKLHLLILKAPSNNKAAQQMVIGT